MADLGRPASGERWRSGGQRHPRPARVGCASRGCSGRWRVSARSQAVARETRRLVVEAAIRARTCHIGSSLSIVDILAVLYADVLRDDSGRPAGRFLLSKGHAASALYGTLVVEGVLSLETMLTGYCSDGGSLAGHPERGVAGVEMTGGSLGHGPAIAVGIALAERHAGRSHGTYCLVGDGELGEGSVWEALALAGQLGLDGLTVIVDDNGLQGLGPTADVLGAAPLRPKLEAFGFAVERGRRPRPRRAGRRVRARYRGRGTPARGDRAHDQGLRDRLDGGRRDVPLPHAARGGPRHACWPGWGGSEMRDAFFSALTAAAERDERVWALTGDLGIGLFDDFCRVAPGRYLNVGIAEQALVGVAAGLAYAGQRPVAYSIAPFLTARAHEQVRVDVAHRERQRDAGGRRRRRRVRLPGTHSSRHRGHRGDARAPRDDGARSGRPGRGPPRHRGGARARRPRVPAARQERRARPARRRAVRDRLSGDARRGRRRRAGQHRPGPATGPRRRGAPRARRRPPHDPSLRHGQAVRRAGADRAPPRAPVRS